ncbi:MAG: hypothetical protein JSU77_09760 [Fidelibacterota bacterium]|nr:MAG: hypothetical protein JSU77_09760 [Candidatus Neomarinimicrobiota bacterium]
MHFYRSVHRKGITIIGAHNACRPKVDEMFPVKTIQADLRVALALLAKNRIRIQSLISDKVPAEAAPQAYQRLWSRKEALVTIALDWTS